MKKHREFKEELEKTKAQLIKFSKEALELAKRGEKEVVKFSKQGKLHIDSTAAGLKKERLYYQIGKEYMKLKDPSSPSAPLTKLIKELKKTESTQRAIQRKISISKKVGKKKSD